MTIGPEPVPGVDVDALIARFGERVSITSGEIFAALPQLEPETAELAAIYTRLEERGIEVVDEIVDELQREDEERVAHTDDSHRSPRANPVVRRR